MGSCKRQRSRRALDRGARSASMEQCLPQEMLEAILGKVDRGTLCTARLVSRTFCAAASANISSLTLESPCQAMSLERFPLLKHVRVDHFGEGQSLAELDPRLCAIMTHLTVTRGETSGNCMIPGTMTFPELPEMPKLRELDVDLDAEVDRAEVLQNLTNLVAIRIGVCDPDVVMTITTMTWLTALVIGRLTDIQMLWDSEDISFFKHATNLRKLEALQIPVSHEALPLIGDLTGLTGLTWLERDVDGIRGMLETYSIAPLSRLSRLRSLEIPLDMSESNLAMACSLGSGSLTNLCLCGSRRASADCVRLLASQTALLRLRLGEVQLCDLRHMVGLRMELLQSLELPPLNSVDAEGLDALLKATSLTELDIYPRSDPPDLPEGGGLMQTIGQLTQLRCLRLGLGGTSGNHLELHLALSSLKALTMLRVSSGDLQVLSGLSGLQVLELSHCHLTDDVVQQLAVLTNLRTVTVRNCGVTSLAPATNILNPLREARGWPPVDAFCVVYPRPRPAGQLEGSSSATSTGSPTSQSSVDVPF